ncbi:MAG TPA: hypothetical protein VEW68_09980, partial [Patescibacteria group bacterium]|nr:hypothetical protein [Patescibacteria group bacterium]
GTRRPAHPCEGRHSPPRQACIHQAPEAGRIPRPAVAGRHHLEAVAAIRHPEAAVVGAVGAAPSLHLVEAAAAEASLHSAAVVGAADPTFTPP